MPSRLSTYFIRVVAGASLSVAVLCVVFCKVQWKRNSQLDRTQSRMDESTARNFSDVFKDYFLTDLPITTYQWRPVDGRKDLHMFSAYFDDVESPVVRVLGSGLHPGSFEVTCILQWTEKPFRVEVIRGHLEKHNMMWDKGILISVSAVCPVSPTNLPDAVSVVRKAGNKPTNRILVQRPKTERLQFTLCLPAFYDQYSNVHELVQCFEMAQILGAKKIRAYNYSVSSEVSKVLEIYQKAGIADIIPYDLPKKEDIPPNTNLKFYGQDTAMNDCLYANLHSSKYLVVQDKDELLLPYKYNNWGDMMADLTRQNPAAGSFLMLNTFFHLSWPDSTEDSQELAKRFKLNVLLKVWRERQIMAPTVRSKTIIIPERVHTAGVHQVITFRKGFREVSIDPKIGLLHHYRDDGNPNDKVKENSAQRFRDELLKRVSSVWSKIEKKTQ